MKRFRNNMLSNSLAMALVISSLSTTHLDAATVVDFTDIKGHWAANQIQLFHEKGFIQGYEDNTFRPNNYVTRAEFITMINTAFGYTDKGTESFTDVRVSDWFYNDVLKAVYKGYIQGYGDGTFKPNAYITREEACSMIAKVLSIEEEGNTSFKDDSSIGSWAKKYVKGLVTAEVINGYEDNTFKPKQSPTRAEAITILKNAKLGGARIVDKITISSEADFSKLDANNIYREVVVNLTETDITVDLDDVYINKLTITSATRGSIIFGGESKVDEISVSKDIKRLDIIATDGTEIGTAEIAGTNVSLALQDTAQAKKVVVSKNATNAKITAQGDAIVKSTQLLAGATLMDSSISSKGSLENFITVSVETTSPVYLYATIDKVYVSVKGTIYTGESKIIKTLTVESGGPGSYVYGPGVLNKIIVEAENCIFSVNSIGEQEIANGIKKLTITDMATTPSSAVVATVSTNVTDETTVTITSAIANYNNETVTVTIENTTTGAKYTLSSTDKKQVTVDKDGKVTCIKENLQEGSYKVTVSADESYSVGSFDIVVKKDIVSSGGYILTNKTIKLNMSEIKNVKFTLDDEDIKITSAKYYGTYYLITTENEISAMDHDITISADGYNDATVKVDWTIISIDIENIEPQYTKNSSNKKEPVTLPIKVTNILEFDDITVTLTPCDSNGQNEVTKNAKTITSSKNSNYIEILENTLKVTIPDVTEGYYKLYVKVRDQEKTRYTPIHITYGTQDIPISYAIAITDTIVRVGLNGSVGTSYEPKFTVDNVTYSSSQKSESDVGGNNTKYYYYFTVDTNKYPTNSYTTPTEFSLTIPNSSYKDITNYKILKRTLTLSKDSTSIVIDKDGDDTKIGIEFKLDGVENNTDTISQYIKNFLDSMYRADIRITGTNLDHTKTIYNSYTGQQDDINLDFEMNEVAFVAGEEYNIEVNIYTNITGKETLIFNGTLSDIECQQAQ